MRHHQGGVRLNGEEKSQIDGSKVLREVVLDNGRGESTGETVSAAHGFSRTRRTASVRTVPGVHPGNVGLLHPAANKGAGRPMANKLHRLGAPRAGHAWQANAREVDMATPPAKPVPLRSLRRRRTSRSISRAPQLSSSTCRTTSAAQGGWVDHIGGDYRPDRKPINRCRSCCRRCAGRGSGHLGELGQSARSGQHAAQPDPSLQAHRRRHRSRRPAARQRRARAGEGLHGPPRSSTSSSRSRATSRSTSIASAASGTRRSTASCATWASRRSCSPASTPTSACCTR